MNFPRFPFGRQQYLTGTQRTRLLSKRMAPQRCTVPDCLTSAVGEHKGKLYCSTHFLTTLQQQWQE
jgi:hypothetical protein